IPVAYGMSRRDEKWIKTVFVVILAMSWKAMQKSSNVPKMRFTAEVAQRLQKPRSCQGLLYAPLRGQLLYQKTRRYVFEYQGIEASMRGFVSKVLLDAVSQDLHFEDTPFYNGYRFYLDYGIKTTALDLEKEMILSYHRASS